jgi:hypothetical protein
MNAKKAKKLRQLVRVAVKDKDVPAISYTENQHNRKFVTVEKVSGDGKSTYKAKEQVATGTIRVEPRTVRGVYLGMKKQFAKAMAQ